LYFFIFWRLCYFDNFGLFFARFGSRFSFYFGLFLRYFCLILLTFLCTFEPDVWQFALLSTILYFLGPRKGYAQASHLVAVSCCGGPETVVGGFFSQNMQFGEIQNFWHFGPCHTNDFGHDQIKPQDQFGQRSTLVRKLTKLNLRVNFGHDQKSP